MRIGLSSASFYPDIYTEKSIEKIKKLGFDCGEIFLNSLSEYDEEFVKVLKEEKLKHNFEVISVHSFSSAFEPYLFDRYDRRRKDLTKIFSMVCRAASMLGAKYYTFHGIKLMDMCSFDAEFVMRIYSELAYIACEEGITLTQENVSWCMSGQTDFLKLLKEKCKYPIGFTLDIKQAYKANVDVKEYIAIMGEDLRNVHINDRSDSEVCLLPGRGDVDYKELLKGLDRIGYKGDYIIEVYRENYSTDKELMQARDHLKKILT